MCTLRGPVLTRLSRLIQSDVMPKRDLLSAKDLGRLLGVSYSRARQMLNRREVRGRKVGSVWVVERQAVERFRKQRAI